MGRDVIRGDGPDPVQQGCPKWAGPDFEAKPEVLESPEWRGDRGAIWYFLTRKEPDRPRPRREHRDGRAPGELGGLNSLSGPAAQV